MNHPRTKHECTTPQRFQMLRWILAFFILVTLIGAEPSSAQNESGRRILDKRYFGYIWYDSTKHKYHVRVPIIRRLPPLSSDMPLNVLRAYIHLDSLARFNTNGQLIVSPEGWLAEPDLLRKTIASYYRVMDYDPLRYQQYDYETALKSWLFKSELGGTTRFLPEALAKAASNQRESEALDDVFFSDYVLRIKVLAIDSMATGFAFGSSHVFNVTAQVLDTIKGQIFHPCQESSDQSVLTWITQTNSFPCLNFQYYHSTGEKYGIYKDEDSALIDGNGGFAMRIGQEAVVFLNFAEQRFDSTHDAFQLFLGPPGTAYTLVIAGDQVRDVNRTWSDDIMMSYADWRRRFLELRDKILNGTY